MRCLLLLPRSYCAGPRRGTGVPQRGVRGAAHLRQPPEELWTQEMFHMKNPVVRFEKALYGHKHSGVYWQDVCDKQCKQAGFEPIGQQCPPTYYNDKYDMLLIVYVDDMKMAGPAEHMKECWRRLGDTKLIPDFALEKPKGDVEEGDDGAEAGTTHTFLGC